MSSKNTFGLNLLDLGLNFKVWADFKFLWLFGTFRLIVCGLSLFNIFRISIWLSFDANLRSWLNQEWVFSDFIFSSLFFLGNEYLFNKSWLFLLLLQVLEDLSESARFLELSQFRTRLSFWDTRIWWARIRWFIWDHWGGMLRLFGHQGILVVGFAVGLDILWALWGVLLDWLNHILVCNVFL